MVTSKLHSVAKSTLNVERIQLRMMTAKAIQLLDKNPKGFFLQVESGSIDKQNHAADPCGQIGETVALDEAIQEALAFANNLIR
jgi:alkaline phosphatase